MYASWNINFVVKSSSSSLHGHMTKGCCHDLRMMFYGCKCNLFTHGARRISQELVQKCLGIPGSNWNLEMLVFKVTGKREYPEKNLSEQSREPTTNSTNI